MKKELTSAKKTVNNVEAADAKKAKELEAARAALAEKKLDEATKELALVKKESLR